MPVQPIIGYKYGSYAVYSTQIKKSSDKKRMFEVICCCGKIEFKRAQHLISGRTTSCKSCASKKTAVRFPPPIIYKGCGGLSKTHFSSIKNGAIRRGIPFNLDIQYLWGLYLKQNKRCALTGDALILTPAYKNSNVNWGVVDASLDRIDNTKGYEIGNVWWVHKTANRFKNNYSMEELLSLCKKIILTYDNPEPSSAKDLEVAEKVQRLTGEESTNNPDTSAQPL